MVVLAVSHPSLHGIVKLHRPLPSAAYANDGYDPVQPPPMIPSAQCCDATIDGIQLRVHNTPLYNNNF